MQIGHPWGNFCQESVGNWPGGLLVSSGLSGTVWLGCGVARECVGSVGVKSHIHPFGACPAGERHDRAIRGRAAQSVLRARSGAGSGFFPLRAAMSW